jgi:hypothetical protein
MRAESDDHKKRAKSTKSNSFSAERQEPDSKERPPYNVPIGYLRAFVTLLVLAHHAVLAYHPVPMTPPTSLLAEPRWWQAFPVLDAQRSTAVAFFVGWNDAFFMALMFFLSGLFVPASLDRKGVRSFLGGRLRRLGLPFIAVAVIVTPLAYYPTYLGTTSPEGISGYANDWLSLGQWPAGPAWFLWMLLVFGAAAAGLFALRPGWVSSLERPLSTVMARPMRSFGALVALSALVYLPMTFVVDPLLHWTTFGPFSFQTSRFVHYALYFFAGVVVGARGLERDLLATEGPLSRRWLVWVGVGILAYAFDAASTLAVFAEGAGMAEYVAANVGFVLSCAASSFAVLALFLRFARTARRVFDSLRDNAYGMYLVHYAFVSWLQYAVLDLALPALGKAAAVIAATVVLSWATTAALRRVPAVRRVI